MRDIPVKNMEEYEKLKEIIASYYLSKGDTIVLVRPLVGGKSSFTGNEIANEIEKGTKFGQKMLTNLVKLTIELVSRGQETLKSPKYK